MDIRFGLFAFNETTRELRCSGRPVHLSPKAFDLLALLLRQRPHAVARADLHAALWPDTFVSDGSLAVLVAEIRRALGDSAQHPSYVRTVNRFGYAFVEPVDEADRAAESYPAASTCVLTWGTDRVRLKSGDNILGRDPGADVCLDGVGVSRQHAVIRIDDTGAVVRDLSSKNGTFINGSRITSPTHLADRAELRLGALTLTFCVIPASAPTQTVSHSGTVGEPR